MLSQSGELSAGLMHQSSATTRSGSFRMVITRARIWTDYMEHSTPERAWEVMDFRLCLYM